jgi:transposase InsO family protein
VSAKYEFIDAEFDAEKASYPIVKMCAWRCPVRASTNGGRDLNRRPRGGGMNCACRPRRCLRTRTRPIGTSGCRPSSRAGACGASLELVRPGCESWTCGPASRGRYLATVIDCHTKECVGYAMADHVRTELVTDTLDTATRDGRIEPKRSSTAPAAIHV